MAAPRATLTPHGDSDNNNNVSTTEKDVGEEELEETDAICSSPDGKAAATSSSVTKRAREDDDDDDDSGEGPSKKSNKSDENDGAAIATPHSGAEQPRIGTAPAGPDDMEENMGCGICHEILHDCVSVWPCLHSFCGGCYSEWRKRSKECPQCRKIVHNVAENHTINNLVNAFLKMNPEKRRNAADLAQLDAWNKITDDPSRPTDWQDGWQVGWQAGWLVGHSLINNDVVDAGDNDDDDNDVDGLS